MQADPILREVYRIKDELNREIGGDVGKLIELLRESAKEHPERMVQPAAKAVTPKRGGTASAKRAK